MARSPRPGRRLSPGRQALRRHWVRGAPVLLVLASLVGSSPCDIAFLALLGPVLLALVLYDVRYLVLPDPLVGLVLVSGLVRTLVCPEMGPGPEAALVGVAAGGAVLGLLRALYRRLRGGEGLGLGDVKLFAAGGAWIGWTGLADFMLVACAAALGAVLVARLRAPGSLWTRSRLPFGPALAVALYAVVIMR